jgi:hypothetical protein
MCKLRLFRAFAICLTIVISSCDNEPLTPTKNGLIAYYEFQGNLDDSIGDNDGEGFNVDYLVEGQKKSLALNGLNAYADLSESFDYENITISVWFNLDKVNDDLGIIYSSDSPSTVYGLTVLSTQVTDTGHRLNFNVADQLWSTVIEANTWYNATIVKQGKQYQYFLDGVLVEEGVFEKYVHSGNGVASAIVGAGRSLDIRFFDGWVDNLRIYNRGLTQKEIKTIYHAKRK